MSGQTLDAIRETIPSPIRAASEIESRDVLFERLLRFIEAGLVSRQDASDLVLEKVIGDLQHPPQPGQGDAIARHAARWGRWATGDASPTSLQAAYTALDNAAVSSPWREELLLLWWSRLKGVDAESEVPVSRSTVRDLLELHGEEAAGVLDVWLKHGPDGPSDASAVIPERMKSDPPEAVLGVLRRLSDSLAPKERQAMLEPLFSALLKSDISEALLEAGGITEVSDEAVAGWLVGLYNEATNYEDRDKILQTWRAAEITSPAARRQLLREVLIPIAREGATSYDLARRRLDLAADPPHGLRTEIVSELIQAAPDEARLSQMRDKMVDVRLAEKKKSWWNRLGL